MSGERFEGDLLSSRRDGDGAEREGNPGSFRVPSLEEASGSNLEVGRSPKEDS
jgi:hypothetical protein